jgi:hypothetical protein
MYLIPTWLPDGMILRHANTDSRPRQSYDSLLLRSDEGHEILVVGDVWFNHQRGLLGRPVDVGSRKGILRTSSGGTELTWKIGRVSMVATTAPDLDPDALVEIAAHSTAHLDVDTFSIDVAVDPTKWTVIRPKHSPFFAMYTDTQADSHHERVLTISGSSDLTLAATPTMINIGGTEHEAHIFVGEHDAGTEFSWIINDVRVTAYGCHIDEVALRQVLESITEIDRSAFAAYCRTATPYGNTHDDGWTIGIVDLLDDRHVRLHGNLTDDGAISFGGELDGHGFGGHALRPSATPSLQVMGFHTDPTIGYAFSSPDLVQARGITSDGKVIPLVRLEVDHEPRGWVHVLVRYDDEPPIEVIEFLNSAGDVVYEER